MDNGKILVEIYIPASGKCIDVRIPLSLRVWEVLSLLSKVIVEISDGCFEFTDQTTLCDRKTGSILDMNITAEELGLKNGSKLMLI